jgi:hypothetical protein
VLPGHRAWFAALFLAILAYLPGLNGGFAFDDYHNVIDNPALQPPALSAQALWEGVTSNASGPFKRPLAALSFLANFLLFGASALAFKAVNLAIHLANGALVFAVLCQILPRLMGPGPASHFAARAGTALWLLHPLQLTSVLYVVQRMTSLAAFFTLLAIWGYLRLRLAVIESGRPASWLASAGVALAFGAGVACKENALLLPVFLVLIEATVLHFAGAPRLKRLAITAICGAMVGLGVWLVATDYLHQAFAARPYSGGERMLTELRVLWFYVGQLVFPHPGRMALFHEFTPVSTALWQPWSTLLALSAWLTAGALAWHLRRKLPVFAFGFGWFLIGHLLESTIVPLDLVYEHRNYLPSLGPLMIVAAGLGALSVRDFAVARAVVIGACLILASMTAYRAWQWSDPYTHALLEARHHPHSYRPHYELGRLEILLYQETGETAALRSARRRLNTAVRVGNDDFMPLIALVNSYPVADAEPPARLRARLRRDLATHALTAQRLNAVYLVGRCQHADGPCPLRPELVLDVAGALLQNPDLTPPGRAMVLQQLANYYALALADYAAAERVMAEVLELTPENLQQRLGYVHILLAQKKYAEARSQIALLDARRTLWRRIVDPEFNRVLDKARGLVDAPGSSP